MGEIRVAGAFTKIVRSNWYLYSIVAYLGNCMGRDLQLV